MQNLSYAGYWYNRSDTGSQPLITELLDGRGQVAFDFGDDKIIDGGGNKDFLITPKGSSGDLNYVKYRELTLSTDSDASYKLDVIWFNSYDGKFNSGALVALNFSQFHALPNDPTLRLVSTRDYTNDFVASDVFSQTFNASDTPGAGNWYNGLSRGTFTFSGAREDYSFSRTPEKGIVFTAANSDADTLFGYERVAFDNGTLAYDLEGNAGQAFRLYQAAFDRAPDVAGLGYWVRELDAAKGNLTWMANNFIISDEFKTTYGTPESVSNQRFLDLIYQNVLHRAADGDGLAYWMKELEAGFAREAVLASFSESVENKANVAALIDDGIWYV